MGCIKPTFVKRIAKELLEKDPESFSADFDKNKEKLKELGVVESKMVRNRVAGSIVRCVRNKAF